ncbi:MAG: hypothetical protein J0H49_13550 [Acidobacteria bacterium]|nr:hypothetical protein [Acidobacteriota bacterium]
MRNTYTLTIALVAAALSSGCRLTTTNTPATGTLVICLFDRSITADAPEIKDRYLADFVKVVAQLRPGDTVIADAITENPAATMRFPVHVVLPAYDPARTNPLIHGREMQAATRTLLEQVERLVRQTASTKKTAILDALYVTRKALQGEAGKSTAHHALIVFSDMVEDSGRANFERDPLGVQHTKSLLQREEGSDRLPDLKGVDVWAAGATPNRSMGEARIRAIESFWHAYFSRCGASLTADHYAPALLNFSLVRNQPPIRDSEN